MTWKFTPCPAEGAGPRIARVAREATQDGPIGRWIRTDTYRDFLRVWGREGDLIGIKTSCAVFGSAACGNAGKVLHKPWNGIGGWGITSWLGVRFGGAGYVKRSSGEHPEPGDIGYRDYSLRKLSGNGHVQVFVERVGDLWITAEGGGGLTADESAALRKQWQAEGVSQAVIATRLKQNSGTVCRLSKPKDVFGKDGLNRDLLCWWKPIALGVPESFDGTVSTFVPIKYGARGRRVSEWQLLLLQHGERLPVYGVDGDFGGETLAATRAFQVANGLLPTGEVNEETWDAAQK